MCSLRAIDPERFAIVDESLGGALLEEIEESKAFFEVYDGAVYMWARRAAPASWVCKLLQQVAPASCFCELLLRAACRGVPRQWGAVLSGMPCGGAVLDCGCGVAERVEAALPRAPPQLPSCAACRAAQSTLF